MRLSPIPKCSNARTWKKMLRVPFVDPDPGFAVSPSGSKAAVSWNLSGKWEIYILEKRFNDAE
jgi:hypothetical protein